MTRRRFLQGAGGITFLALVPVGRGVFAAVDASPNRATPPLFTALPYLQPGNHSRLIEGKEGIVVAWQTEPKAADFEVEYGPTERLGQRANIERGALVTSDATKDLDRYCYSAKIEGLKLGTRYHYQVKCNGAVIMTGFFTTRSPRGRRTRFVSFGDSSHSGTADNVIAYRAAQQNPEFIMHTGDNVYPQGTNSQYEQFFFSSYNANTVEESIGSSLLRSIPFYTVLANHDVFGKFCDFDKRPDSLGYYTAMHLPLNGPQPPQPMPLGGKAEQLANFRALAGARWSRMANYSFDYGDAHFTCLDSNVYVDPTSASLWQWIENDLRSTDAPWKFVVYHHPAYNVGKEHYAEQHMRVFSPLFEALGVDMVLTGHEHTYQRPRPFKFAPRDISLATKVSTSKRYVPGHFDIDDKFDGKANNKPEGVIYLTTGAGGASLYDKEWNDNPAKWTYEQDNNINYMTKFVSDRHSLTVFDIQGSLLTMAQIDINGQEIDRITISKA